MPFKFYGYLAAAVAGYALYAAMVLAGGLFLQLIQQVAQ